MLFSSSLLAIFRTEDSQQERDSVMSQIGMHTKKKGSQKSDEYPDITEEGETETGVTRANTMKSGGDFDDNADFDFDDFDEFGEEAGEHLEFEGGDDAVQTFGDGPPDGTP